MPNAAFKLYRFLLFAAFLAVSTLHCLAQFDIDFSVAPVLAPSLTDSPTTAPVTTLSIDLLAPQHVFVYDATGASISANNLDPVIRADVGAAPAETDTAIRDSSQAGQLNPYSTGSSRLSTLFSGAGATARAGTGSPSPASADETAPQSTSQQYMEYGQPSSTAAQPPVPSGSENYQSSWGSGGSATSGSSWGSRSIPSPRAGAGSASQSGASLDAGSQSGSDMASPEMSPAAIDRYSTQVHSNIGWTSAQLARSRPTANGIPSTVSSGPTIFGVRSIDRFSAHPGQSQDPYASVPNSAAVPPSTGGSQSPDSTLTFSQPDTGASGSSSPFRSFGDEDFFQPNILAVGKIDIFADSRRSSSNRERLSSRIGTTNPLETSASHYGLESRRTSTALSRSNRNRNGEHVNPYLTDDASAQRH
jgi:hypothetical protein